MEQFPFKKMAEVENTSLLEHWGFKNTILKTYNIQFEPDGNQHKETERVSQSNECLIKK